MSKVFIPCAIDHGTTNSSIAVMEETGPRVIKPDGQNDVMPSAVFYNHRGRLLVGQAAANAILRASDDGIGYTGYKIRMGHDDRYEFPGGKVLTVPEMGGVVLGKLLQAYRDEDYPDYKAAVITVPAKFEQPACTATMEAAKHAGLLYTQTLMEPVAAALAYGFQAEDKNAKWMIFDLGGGTLDISLVMVRDGHCTVLPEGHAGDNHLGGRKFDRELLDYVLGPRKADPQYEVNMAKYRRLDRDYHPLRKQYALENFTKETRSNDWGALIMATEIAKIELSDNNDAVIGGNRAGLTITDDNKKPVTVEFSITRAAYEHLIASDVERTVQTCKNLLGRNRLEPSEVQRVILIGGPSKTPYIQQVLRSRLGIPLESSIDPMTAVAQGAAIFAHTQEIPTDILRKIPDQVPEDAKVRLEYDRSSKVPVCNVTGMVQEMDEPIEGWSAEIKRKDGRWSSGALPIDASGLFEIDVHLLEGSGPTRSQFETRVFDAKGQVVATLEEPEIWFRYVTPGNDVLPSDLMVGVKGNVTEVLLKQGVDLPNENSKEFVTSQELRRGKGENMLLIPVYEGLEHFLGAVDPHEDTNIKVGELRVESTDLKSDLAEGSVVEVTLERDRDRQIRVHAYVRSLDQEFEAEFNAESKDPDADKMAETFKDLRQALEAIERIEGEYPTPVVTEGLKALKQQDVLAQIEKNLERTKQGDRECQSRCYRDILKLTGALHHLRDLQTEVRLRRMIKYLEGSLEGHDLEEYEAIRKEFEQALQDQDKKTLASIENSLNRLYRVVRLRAHYQLIDDLVRFPKKFRGTPIQLSTYDDGVGVANRLIEKDKSGQEITDSDLRDAEQAHKKLWEHWGQELTKWPPPPPTREGPGTIEPRD